MKSVPVALDVGGIELKGEIYLPAAGRGAKFPALLICHGVPRGIRTAPDRNQGYRFLAKYFSGAGFAAMIFNFRGTGESGGDFDLMGWTKDLQAVIDLFSSRPEVDPDKFYLLGFSGGAAVSVYVAARDLRVKAVALGACPAGFESLFPAERLPGIIKWARGLGIFRNPGFPEDPQRWLKDLHSVRPADYIQKISPRPLLLLHGDEDERVPVEHARQLYEKAGEPKKMVIIPGAGHQLRTEKRAVKEALAWLQQL